jgi:DnaJ-class molecular chaperone
MLGLRQGASEAEIKKSYKKAALKHHPDKVRQIFSRKPLLSSSCTSWSF